MIPLCTGCSGINASRSVSPIDFLMPGSGSLMRGFLYNNLGSQTNNVNPFPSSAAVRQIASAK